MHAMKEVLCISGTPLLSHKAINASNKLDLFKSRFLEFDVLRLYIFDPGGIPRREPSVDLSPRIFVFAVRIDST